MEKHSPTLHTNSTPTRIEKHDNGQLTVHLESGNSVGLVDKPIWAIGRESATDNINIEAAGRRLCEYLFNNKPDEHLDYSNIGTVGLSEKEVIDEHDEANVTVYRSQFTALYQAITEDYRDPTRMKLVCG
jgi:glutathione reductase (NADPH)